MTEVTNFDRYTLLRQTFESRLARLADILCSAISNAREDEVLLRLRACTDTRGFAPAHPRLLIQQYLGAQEDVYFHEMAFRIADAEARVGQMTRTNQALRTSLLKQKQANLREHSHPNVHQDIQDIRLQYQVTL